MATKSQKVVKKTKKAPAKSTGKDKHTASASKEKSSLAQPTVDENSEKCEANSNSVQIAPSTPRTTDLTEVDRKDIREAFDILDEDGDGKLSTAELETLLRGQFVVASNKELKELLENMDVDKNGTVDYEEFEDFVKRNGLYKASMEEVSEDMRDAFQVFDKDGDGYIDVEEFKTVMMTMGDKMSEEEVQKMMKDADANGDGKIDYKEFCNFMSKGIY